MVTDPKLKPWRRRIMRAGVLIGSTVVGLLLVEGSVRLVAPQRVGIGIQESVWGLSVPRANLDGWDVSPGEFEVRVRTNADRFRGARPTAPKPGAGTIRIAVLGDSFTFGEGAGDEETYPAQLERALGANVEVLNAGNRDTGTGEQALYFDAWVKRFAPKWVVLTVYVNDLGDDRRRTMFVLDEAGRAQPRSLEDRLRADAEIAKVRSWTAWIPFYDGLAERSHLLALSRRAASQRLRGRRAGAGSTAPPTTDERARQLEQGLRLMTAEVRWLLAQVRGEGASLAIVFAAPREDVSTTATGVGVDQIRAQSRAMVGALSTLCKADGVPFLDLRASLRAAGGERLFNERDFHCTPEGYRVMGEAVARMLRQEAALGR